MIERKIPRCGQCAKPVPSAAYLSSVDRVLLCRECWQAAYGFSSDPTRQRGIDRVNAWQTAGILDADTADWLKGAIRDGQAIALYSRHLNRRNVVIWNEIVYSARELRQMVAEAATVRGLLN